MQYYNALLFKITFPNTDNNNMNKHWMIVFLLTNINTN